MKPGDRIRQLRKAQKLTLNELAQRVGSDVGNLSRLERGRQGYSDAMLEKISTALSVPISALFSVDTGEPQRAGTDDLYRVDVLDISAITDSAAPTRDAAQVVHSMEYVRSEANVIFNHKPESAVRLINIRGDSMEGTLEPGDLVFVDISVRFFDGDGVYVFEYHGDIFVKRLQKVKSQLYVISDNPRYKEWTISGDELPMLHVAGRVMLSQSQQFRRHS